MAVIQGQFALFNNWNFSNVPGLQVYSTDPFKGGQRGLNILQVARKSARKTVSGYNKANSIQVGIYITVNGKTALEQALDVLWTNILNLEGQLVVPQSGGVRAYTATYSGIRINTQKGGFLDATLTFECSDSYGYDANYTVIQPATDFTASLVTMQYTQGGSADSQAPIIQARLKAISGASGSVTIGNARTGQAVTITRTTWAVNDLIIVDTQNDIVTVNGVEVAFTNALPKTVPSNVAGVNTPQQLTYQDTFTSRTVNLFAYVYNRYS